MLIPSVLAGDEYVFPLHELNIDRGTIRGPFALLPFFGRPSWASERTPLQRRFRSCAILPLRSAPIRRSPLLQKIFQPEIVANTIRSLR